MRPILLLDDASDAEPAPLIDSTARVAVLALARSASDAGTDAYALKDEICEFAGDGARVFRLGSAAH